MSDANLAGYGPEIRALLSRAPLNPLDAGAPDAAARPLLAALSNESFQPKTVRDPLMASCCRAGLWLRFNYLDESHKISQDIETPEGSFWHGILHRREGDFDNAKYWFRRVGTHPVYTELCESAAKLAAATPESPATTIAWKTTWDALAFVDLCAKVISGWTAGAPLCQEVQRREWELLFDYCWRNAVAE
jgi:hypothetical protein